MARQSNPTNNIGPLVAADVLRIIPGLTHQDLSRISKEATNAYAFGSGTATRRVYDDVNVYHIAFVAWLEKWAGTRAGVRKVWQKAFLRTQKVTQWEGQEPEGKIEPMAWEDFEPDHFMIVPAEGKVTVINAAKLGDFMMKSSLWGVPRVIPVGRIKADVDRALANIRGE